MFSKIVLVKAVGNVESVFFFLLKLAGLWLFDFVIEGKNSSDLLGYLFVKLGHEFAYETS